MDGKSKAARRVLPMTPTVHALLKARWEAQGCPTEGRVFPSDSAEGYLTQDVAAKAHAAALKASKVAAFVPYVLRHTALTRLGKAAGGDVFALARIAGHSTITVTQKYVHPEAETIEEVFSRMKVVGTGVGIADKRVGTKVGTVAELESALLLGEG